ncbi:efflux RND transporter periplasmic adaptor subunit [Granulicella tundricola]|uniref:Efflux transporter, RND family, MFP subunit n=1 Tax=Granulicella tundricola (strain ATCC BAA-1859 / DSM 23138 / MP5ACTX9) TaxID=1198114 RepID=E8X2U2_GRATM|nr:efflux RND transporter periplasmic adaptor subunit [Granulicella tundricola]ADW70389.1 efflux transporter, RND family, MFP subunit [Granulicella tundricola MP5ACTX9]
MPSDQNPDETHRLSDGRSDIGDEFSHPERPEERRLGESFADPNAIDDTKLGKAFEKTNSSAKKHHRPVKEVVEAPFKHKSSKKVLYIILACVVIIFIIVLIAGAIPRLAQDKETRKRADDTKNAVPVVEAVRVQTAKSGAGLVIPGTTTPLTEASVYARATGYLTRRYVDIGDHVHKGQLLAVIDAPDLDQQVLQAREQLNQAQAQLAQQKTQLALTEVTVNRYRALVSRGVFSRQDGDQQETNFQAQRANVASADRNVDAFRANLNHAIALQSFERVTSPFDGVVTQRNVDTGAYISTTGSAGNGAPPPAQTPGLTNGSSQQGGSTNTSGTSGSGASLAGPSTGGSQGGPLFSIAQVQRLRILVSVPEGYASMIATGQHTELHFQEFPNNTFYGDVTRTAAAIDQNSRTLLTEVQVDNHDGHLLSGMYAVVTFAQHNGGGPANMQSGPIMVTGDAIAIRNDRPTIAVIDSNNKIHLQPVIIGRDFGAETEIVSGLKSGDLIASIFTDQIAEGATVKPQENKKTEQKAAPTSAPPQNTPPGGSTQYGDPGVTDQDMQGQAAKPGQKQGAKSGKETKAGGPNKGSNQ